MLFLIFFLTDLQVALSLEGKAFLDIRYQTLHKLRVRRPSSPSTATAKPTRTATTATLTTRCEQLRGNTTTEFPRCDEDFISQHVDNVTKKFN